MNGFRDRAGPYPYTLYTEIHTIHSENKYSYKECCWAHKFDLLDIIFKYGMVK